MSEGWFVRWVEGHGWKGRRGVRCCPVALTAVQLEVRGCHDGHFSFRAVSAENSSHSPSQFISHVDSRAKGHVSSTQGSPTFEMKNLRVICAPLKRSLSMSMRRYNAVAQNFSPLCTSKYKAVLCPLPCMHSRPRNKSTFKVPNV